MEENELEKGILSILEVLNLLGKSTNDYYLVYDFAGGLIHFSDNVTNAKDIFRLRYFRMHIR